MQYVRSITADIFGRCSVADAVTGKCLGCDAAGGYLLGSDASVNLLHVCRERLPRASGRDAATAEAVPVLSLDKYNTKYYCIGWVGCTERLAAKVDWNIE